MHLQFAKLHYGMSSYDVKPHEGLPLPTEFDFEQPVECAKKIFAMMSNASGGHPLFDCTLRIYRDRHSANLTAKGVHVYFRMPNHPKLSLEEVIASHDASEVFALGTVVTDQYGDGWKRAIWKAPKPSTPPVTGAAS